MGCEKEFYKSKIDAILHYVNMSILYDWSCESINLFNTELSVDKLAAKAAMFVRNFHLIFKAYTGERVHQYINRLRLEYAQTLLKSGQYTSEVISEHVGFANVSAFYNAFRKQFKQTPGKFKNISLFEQIDFEEEKYTFDLSFTIENIAERPLLFLSYFGNYDSYSNHLFEYESWEVLYQYAVKHDLLPSQEEYWGICYDDTSITDADKCRFYACMTVSKPVKSKLTDSVKSMMLSSGLYAIYLYKGSYSLLEPFYDAILRNLPSGYLLGDGVILERYLNSPQNTPEHELLTEVLLPLKPYK